MQSCEQQASSVHATRSERDFEACNLETLINSRDNPVEIHCRQLIVYSQVRKRQFGNALWN
eukprot:5487978-Pleurochrysis_carterae.AAC.1